MRALRTAAAWALCWMALAMVGGCANSYSAAQQARGALSRAIDQSTQAWVNYDKAKQASIASSAPTKEAAVAALTAYRSGEQAKVIKVINASWAGLVGIDQALALYNAGQKGGLAGAVTAAYAAIADVTTALTLLGVAIPTAGAN